MVEVFKTSVQTKKEANYLIQRLQLTFPHHKINFDLEDCDNILRIETEDNIINVPGVIHLLNSHGYQIEVLAGEILYLEVKKV